MKKFIYTALSFAPAVAFAQGAGIQTGNLQAILTFIGTVVRQLIPIIFGLAIVYFFWGLAKYVRSAGDAKAAAEGKSIMIYGVIAIAVMVSIYGLVAWLQNLFGVTAGGAVVLPVVPGLP